MRGPAPGARAVREKRVMPTLVGRWEFFLSQKTWSPQEGHSIRFYPKRSLKKACLDWNLIWSEALPILQPKRTERSRYVVMVQLAGPGKRAFGPFSSNEHGTGTGGPLAPGAQEAKCSRGRGGKTRSSSPRVGRPLDNMGNDVEGIGVRLPKRTGTFENLPDGDDSKWNECSLLSSKCSFMSIFAERSKTS